MGRRTVNWGNVERSLRDLTKIYNPQRKDVKKFVNSFVVKYKVDNGFKDELVKIVLDELDKMGASKK
jgi:hypothetical protein